MANSKKEHSKTLWYVGGGVVVLGILLWPRGSAAPAVTTTATAAPTSVPVSPTYTNTVQFTLSNVQVVPKSYSCQLLFQIFNDTPSPITLSNVVAQVVFLAVPAAQLNNSPSLPNGVIGQINWPLFNGVPYDNAQTIAPGSSYSRWFPVEVPETSAAQWYLQNLNLSMSGNSGITNAPLQLAGYGVVNGQQLPFNVKYNV